MSLARTARLIEATGVQPFDVPTLRRYLSDLTFRASIEAEAVANTARANAAIDAGMAKVRARQEVAWARDAGEGA